MFQPRALQSVRATAVRSEPRRLLARTAAIVAARVCGSALTLAYTVLLARVTSPAELGLALSALSAAFLVSVVASFNVESGSIRFLVRYLAQGDTARAAGFVAVGRRCVAVAALLALPLALGWWAIAPERADPAAWALALLTAPVLAITRVQARHAGALDAVLSGALPRMLVRPTLFVVVLAALHLRGVTIAAAVVMGLHLAAAVLVLLLQDRLLRTRLAFARGAKDTGDWRRWVGAGVMLSPMLVMNEYMNYVLLGSAAVALPAAAVAELGIALALQNLLSFSLSAVDMSFGPRLARAIAAGEGERRRRLLSAAAALKCAAVAVGACVVLALEKPVLGLFGAHYAAAGATFLILLAMPLSAALFGPSALVLNALGRQRALLVGALTGVAGVAVAAPVGGWAGGVDGAALGAAGAFAAAQGLLWLLCRLGAGIDPSAFAALAYALRKGGKR